LLDRQVQHRLDRTTCTRPTPYLLTRYYSNAVLVMGIKTAVKAVLKQQSEPIKLKTLARLVKESLSDEQGVADVTKESVAKACDKLVKAHVKKGLAWYDSQDANDKGVKRSREPEVENAGEDSVAEAAKRTKNDRGNDTGTKVFVSGLHKRAEWQDLKDNFREIGPVNVVRVIPGGMAVVEFQKQEDAQCLVDLDRTERWGRMIRTKFDGVKYTKAQKAPLKHASKPWMRHTKLHK